MNRSEIKRKIKPAAVMFSEYYFYLIAYTADDDRMQPKYYRLDRITAISESREHFALDKAHDFDEGNLREKNQFMFPGEPMKVRFSFCGPSVRAVLDRLPTAKVIEKDGNSYILEADVNNGRGLMMFLLSQGAWVRVLSPEQFAEEMRAEIQSMLEHYTSENNN